MKEEAEGAKKGTDQGDFEESRAGKHPSLAMLEIP